MSALGDTHAQGSDAVTAGRVCVGPGVLGFTSHRASSGNMTFLGVSGDDKAPTCGLEVAKSHGDWKTLLCQCGSCPGLDSDAERFPRGPGGGKRGPGQGPLPPRATRRDPCLSTRLAHSDPSGKTTWRDRKASCRRLKHYFFTKRMFLRGEHSFWSNFID